MIVWATVISYWRVSYVYLQMYFPLTLNIKHRFDILFPGNKSFSLHLRANFTRYPLNSAWRSGLPSICNWGNKTKTIQFSHTKTRIFNSKPRSTTYSNRIATLWLIGSRLINQSVCQCVSSPYIIPYIIHTKTLFGNENKATNHLQQFI